jgi:membrane-bound lytic murein transglycosylase D
MRIRAGSTVLIPKPPGKDSDIPVHLAEHGQLQLDKAAPPKPKTSKPPQANASNKPSSTGKSASTQQKSPSTNTTKSAKTGSNTGSGVSAAVKTSP